MSTPSDVQCIGVHDLCGRYKDFIGGCSVHRRDTMIHVEGIMTTSGMSSTSGFSICIKGFYQLALTYKS